MVNKDVNPDVAKAADGIDAKLRKAAPKITAAQPKTSSAVLAFFKSVFLPMLTPILAGLILKYGGESLRKYLEPARDVLLAAYPVDE